MSEVKGYKVFNPDWTCRGFQYEVGKIFEEDVKPSCCDRGFHFCEKAAYPTHETTGGYLKVLDEAECGQLWWGSLSEHKKNIIKAIPNFDAAIFEQCTGIKINE